MAPEQPFWVRMDRPVYSRDYWTGEWDCDFEAYVTFVTPLRKDEVTARWVAYLDQQKEDWDFECDSYEALEARRLTDTEALEIVWDVDWQRGVQAALQSKHVAENHFKLHRNLALIDGKDLAEATDKLIAYVRKQYPQLSEKTLRTLPPRKGSTY